MKNTIIQIDATPFKQWYETHYAQGVGKKKAGKDEAAATTEAKTRSNKVKRKFEARKKEAKLDSKLEDQFASGRLFACISSRPGQSGRCDGYILEGKELDFYLRKLRAARKH